MTNFHGYKSLLPLTVGFDRLISTLEELDEGTRHSKSNTYPPYNVVKIDDTKYRIEIAVAGFTQDELDITLKENKLTVSGSAIPPEEKNQVEYLHRGIGKRDFTHVYTLADTAAVVSADIENGLLVINLENIIPEEQKPRKIKIGGLPTIQETPKQLLTE
jgi:molecular chaperone IbpA